MKFNKLIAKGLSIGLLINSTSILSYANTEIPNRYQTLEGEYITVDDSTEGNLEEIEIFGNTVQDENNLEDVQSVGDLCVDKNGNPILDSQGREQYKINISSNNKNLFNGEFISNTESGLPGIITNSQKISKNFIKVDNRKFYKLNHNPNDSGWHCLWEFDKNKNLITYSNKGFSDGLIKNLNSNTEYIKFSMHISKIDLDIQLEEGNISTTYIPHNSNKTTILLPTQLQKVGNIKDRLYWDSSKSKYIIEKNIGDMFLKNCSNIIKNSNGGNSNDVVTMFGATLNNRGLMNKNLNIISTHTNSYRVGNEQEREFIWTINTPEIYFTVYNTKLSTYDVSGLLEYNKTANIRFLYELETPELIETNITSKLKIPTYNEKTHIYVETENGINPTLKVTVDRLPQIAKEAVAQAECDNTNHNISLARRYINMLPESLYKDQLQNQLNEIFSSDMVLDVKTATSNLDVYIKSENALSISLDTNQISFNDFSGVEDMENTNAVNITISSTLPYQLNAYLPSEIQNADKSAIMDKRILNIKENSQSDYQYFQNINEKMVLKDNCLSGNDIEHSLDIKLKGGIFHKKDVYKATIKLEAEQK